MMADFVLSNAMPFMESTTDDLGIWYPEERQVQPGVFEIGLVLAGAVSAGSYTAGVIDFLVEALDAWEQAKHRNEDVPRHTVKLRVVAGASAGGITGALLAATCRAKVSHGPVDANPFYDTWVNGIDVKNLLSTDDLSSKPDVNTRRPKVRSLLNAESFKDVTDKAIDFGQHDEDKYEREWLAEGFHLWLTLTNLSGVPYQLNFAGGAGFGHDMYLHQDMIGFHVPGNMHTTATVRLPDCIHLSPDNSKNKPDWQTLGTSALATSAFPLAFPPQTICRNTNDYEYRFHTLEKDADVVHGRPWPHGDRPTLRFEFDSVDGGVMNNEPFELARTALSGSIKRNPRDGHLANRAVIMIDPFTEPQETTETVGLPLHKILKRLLGAFKNQARFKSADVALAQSDRVYSRFLVAPARRGLNGNRYRGDKALATGGLGGFLGLFHKDYRKHDFVLGRENCRDFLNDWFVLPYPGTRDDGKTNPIFDEWTSSQLQGHQFRSSPNDRPNHFQIIPVMPHLAKTPPPHRWPRDSIQSYDDFKEPIEQRLDAVTKMLMAEMFDGRIKRTGIRALWGMFVRPSVIDGIKEDFNKAVVDVGNRPSAKKLDE